MNFFSVLPTVLISRLIGVLVEIPAPSWMWRQVLRIYCAGYKVNIGEAEHPLEHYRNLAEFFVRNLKPGLRPVGRGIVSPVDGTLRNFGLIHQPLLPQIKGKYYSISDLLGDGQLAEHYKGGTFFNLYLSPRDYHQIHSPVSGCVRTVIYRPGRLLPVNDGSMSAVDNIFGTNERVTIIIEDPQGNRVAVALIGALNVGKISLAFSPQLSRRIRASLLPAKGFIEHFERDQLKIAVGDKLGTFHLGSSVALLLPPGFLTVDRVIEESRSVRMGSSLSELPEFQT